MSGKTQKKIRKIVKNAYNDQMEEMRAQQIFNAYRERLNSYPLRVRVKIAIKLLFRKF